MIVTHQIKNPAANGVYKQGLNIKNSTSKRRQKQHDFREVNQLALSSLPTLLARWLPGGKMVGGEYSARNPKRADRHVGSFRINVRTGRWADFATGDKGGDVISLAAYLFDLTQGQAKNRLADMLEVRHVK